MTTARAGTKGEAIRLLGAPGVARVELDYESGWQDAIELGRLGQKTGVRVTFRGHENVAVKSHAALIAGLTRPKIVLPATEPLLRVCIGPLGSQRIDGPGDKKAMKLGDYILAGHLLRDVDTVWTE
jgi:hypothetical protein